jgi:hypothetical protein
MHDRNGLSDWSCLRSLVLLMFLYKLIWVTTGSTSTGILPGCIITIGKIFFGWNKKAVWLTRYVKFVTAGKNPSPCFSPGVLTNLLTI